MSVLITGLFFFYFFLLSLFLLCTHCIFYCLLLVVSCCVSALISYFVLGFSWYSLLLCLVYVGGVYILFVFVSVRTPNSSPMIPTLRRSIWGSLFGFMLSVTAVSLLNVAPIEASHNLCSLVEGQTYVCLCLTLLFGFIVVSIVMSIHPEFYR
uniref:NADH dehydrogenase subunit 6 n=1 Tax=Khawia sinensis TaxID=125900 RepID=A0A1W5J2N6_9CEST|nr:NADH dehydrogenase subunit 6 [Khawia sinensis]ALK26538.1 NADH dehydrogenase subunit 6 [Khawia sinensis]